ncbi:MAG: hypothetical protein AXW12_11795 [Thalassospira sp. Nap_22]|nr:MAG: hypothetical protein AXW12_11795 [Thalassospira sp. Nap_22]
MYKHSKFMVIGVIYFVLSTVVLFTCLGASAVAKDTDNPPTGAANIHSLSSGVARLVPDNLFAVDFVSDQVGWVAGYYGTLLHTDNGGQTWTHHALPVNDLIRRIDFLDEQTGWAVSSRGRILKTQDGGASWRVMHEEPGIYLRDVHFVSKQEGWVIGHEATILHTVNGGQLWTKQTLSNFTGRDLPRLNGIASSSAGHLYVVGEFGVIAETVNGGDQWTILSPGQLNVTFVDVTVAQGVGWAVGLGGNVVRISPPVDPVADGAVNREQAAPARISLLPSVISAHLFTVNSDAKGAVVAAGQGVLYKIDPQGDMSLMSLPESTPDYIWYGGAVARPSSDEWVIVGANGSVVGLNVTSGTSNSLVRW